MNSMENNADRTREEVLWEIADKAKSISRAKNNGRPIVGAGWTIEHEDGGSTYWTLRKACEAIYEFRRDSDERYELHKERMGSGYYRAGGCYGAVSSK